MRSRSRRWHAPTTRNVYPHLTIRFHFRRSLQYNLYGLHFKPLRNIFLPKRVQAGSYSEGNLPLTDRATRTLSHIETPAHRSLLFASASTRSFNVQLRFCPLSSAFRLLHYRREYANAGDPSASRHATLDGKTSTQEIPRRSLNYVLCDNQSPKPCKIR